MDYLVFKELTNILYVYLTVGCLVGLLIESAVKEENRLDLLGKFSLITIWPYALWVIFKN